MLQGKKTLILREIPEEGVSKLLSKKDSLAACDIAVFVYDRYLLASLLLDLFYSILSNYMTIFGY